MNTPYTSLEQAGICHICRQEKDLRMGVCLSCSEYVDGEQVGATTHLLWDVRDPEVRWFYHDQFPRLIQVSL